jgi:hypothetical protein
LIINSWAFSPLSEEMKFYIPLALIGVALALAGDEGQGAYHKKHHDDNNHGTQWVCAKWVKVRYDDSYKYHHKG